MEAPEGPMQLARQTAFTLGAMEVRPPTCEVVSAQVCEVLQPRVMQVLVALARANGAVVSRDELIAKCWGGRVVGEDAISLVMAKLRKLAERSGGAFTVETVPRVGYRLAVGETPGARTEHARPRLAVLEFTHPPGDDEQAWFAEALADELTAGLSKSPLLSVTPRQVLVFSDAAGGSPTSVAARLGVDYVLDGKVRSLGGMLRVSVDLIQGETTAWSSRYDRPVSDIFSLLNEIARAIIGTVEPAVLEREESRAALMPAHSLPFWRLFVQARRHFWRSTPQDIRAAEAYLQQALAIEPDDVTALAILSHCQMFDVWMGASADTTAALAQAHRTALRAVSVGGNDAFAHFTLGVVLSLMGRVPEAKAEQRRALELNPYLAAAAGELGRLLAFEGQSEKAITYADRAIAASPNDPHGWLWHRAKAIARFIAGDDALAAQDAADACARGPERFSLHFLLAACHAAAGDVELARRALEDAERLAYDRLGPGRNNSSAYPLSTLKTGHPFQRPADLERYVKALQKSGWQGA